MHSCSWGAVSWELVIANALQRAMHICRDCLWEIWGWLLRRRLFHCIFSPRRGSALFSGASVFSRFSASQWYSPKHITHESGSWSLHCKRVLCRRWALGLTVISVMFWRPQTPLSCPGDETRQTDGRGRLSSQAAFNFHKDDFVS